MGWNPGYLLKSFVLYKMLNYFTGKEHRMKTFNILSENNNSFFEESVILSEKICYLNQESPKIFSVNFIKTNKIGILNPRALLRHKAAAS